MRSDRWQWIPMSATLLATTGCLARGEQGPGGAGQEQVPVHEVIRSAVSPPPITGGTLLMLEDGITAVVADPDRDRVHVVDLEREQVRHTVALRAGDEPGRLVADAEGRVHVAARRGGVVVDLDPASGEVLGRRAVCPNPRGLAFEAEADALHVACAGGELVSLPASGGEPVRRVPLAPDLRDVVITREGLMVSRFRTAELLRIDEDGAVAERHGLPVLERLSFFVETFGIDPGTERLRPNTAWRTVATPDGDWLMLHQASTTRALTIEHATASDEAEDDDDGTTTAAGDGGASDGGGGGDGGGGYGSTPDMCAEPVLPVLTLGVGALDTHHSPLLEKTVLPVDVAVSPRGRIALAVAGLRTHPTSGREGGVVATDFATFTAGIQAECDVPEPVKVGEGQFVAVAFDARDRIVAQSREPAMLSIADSNGGPPTIIDLPGDPRRDTGHDLFHLDAGLGISCASCHPEGGDDGHVWQFADLGPRHTPALTVGLAGTEPFHWEGDIADMQALVHEVHESRMGGRPLSSAHVEALQTWMFALPTPWPLRAPDDAAVARGAALFSAWGCQGCHAGSAMAGNVNVDLGLGLGLQVPGLRGVALHPPYMHDGRALDLPAAVRDMLARTRPGAPEPAALEVSDMVAFLESL